MSTKPQVVMVTAAGSGIGQAIASAFLARGDSVHVTDVDIRALERFLSDHPDASGTLADVSSPEDMQQAFEDLQARHGRLDILVNNAGIAGPTGPVEEISVEDWDRTLSIDLSGAFYVTRLAVPMLKASGGGAIINISSTAGLFGFPNRLPYAVSKWGLIGMTKTLAMELGPSGIRVNAICPGSVEGERIDGVIARDAVKQGKTAEQIRDLYTRQVSMRCFVKPADIAASVLFLASSAGARISGQVLAVDGHTESLSVNAPD